MPPPERPIRHGARAWLALPVAATAANVQAIKHRLERGLPPA